MRYSTPIEDVYLIDLDQKREGFRKFISAWLYKSDGLSFLVDPGPRYSIQTLIESLRELGVSTLDYILLTHIHIDHAGGAGRLLDAYPDAKVICHPKGVRHMIDPSKLWRGSVAVLKEIAEAYGEIYPIDPNKIGFQETIETTKGKIRAIETPGHAVHHLSFLFGDILFAGEVAGVYHKLESGVYARPATPPKFKLEISLASLDRVIQEAPGVICFGHHGYSENAKLAMLSAKRQLQLWVETIERQLALGKKELNQRVLERLTQEDPLFATLKFLDSDIRKREEYFINNSFIGMTEYIETNP